MSLGVHGWLCSPTSVRVIHDANNLDDKNYINWYRVALEKIHPPLIINTVNRLERKRTLLISTTYTNPPAGPTVSAEALNTFPLTQEQGRDALSPLLLNTALYFVTEVN